MYNIEEYFEPETLAEALVILTENPEAKLIAGGTDLLVNMQHHPIKKERFLSIRKLKELQKIETHDDGTLSFGALVTLTQLFDDPFIKQNIPALSEAAMSMGGPQIRNIATLGGNICNGATSADSASTLFVLDAKLKIQSSKGERVVPIREFYAGPGKVKLNQGEILTEIYIYPEDYEGFGGHYIKFAMRKAMDIATLGVSAACRIKEGRFDEVRIGLGVAGPTPLRCLEAEGYAQGKSPSKDTLLEIGKRAVRSTQARTSWRASKEYREHLVEELTQRALNVAIQRAGGVYHV
ncbi:xanthine dehydrogenase FAD-binding subunit XdhB [Desulfitobacterium sp. Sab5]|uniref:xanthine dehydrogenase FAD-binding subunit XdhB n=1 Tax=Desulfitobacterium nosdiversum TaxID=3375356 RepID=UPI003CF0E82C